MGSGNDFLNSLESMKLELMSKWEIETLRFAALSLKASSPTIHHEMKLMMLDELTGIMSGKAHAKDKLALRLFRHYIFCAGDFMLTIDDMRHMNTDDPMGGPIDLKYESWESKDKSAVFRPEWNKAMMDAGSKSVPFSGNVHWVWDNGAISTYRVDYEGSMRSATDYDIDTTFWTGRVSYFDRFDLDPRWTWSPANPQGRTDTGERRTRIGYILNLGTDFDIKSPWMNAKQHVTDGSLVLLN